MDSTLHQEPLLVSNTIYFLVAITYFFIMYEQRLLLFPTIDNSFG